jgi:hypothetical protein
VLPFLTHQMEVELSEPFNMAVRGAIKGRASQSWATCPASSKSLMDKSPPGFREETRRAASLGCQGWRHR